ncbi:MAG: shikimate kinase [Thalassobius sp.]|nr:shikimate kinase [Thalassovita sp.]
MLPQRIYLVGMPASGKSTLGKKLAEELSYQFIDLDHRLEEKEHKSIPEIFQEFGEDHFRIFEKKVLLESLDDKSVIATGGGAPCFFDNMEFILKNGVAIFLNTPVHVLAERALMAAGSRPLLKDFEGEKLIEVLNAKLNNRIKFYTQAHLTFAPDESDISSLINLLKEFKQ